MKKGVYIRELSRAVHGTPSDAALKAKRYGLTFVPILFCWQEADKTTGRNIEDLAEYARAFADVGIEPWIWGYPWIGREQEFADQIGDVLRYSPEIAGVLIDPELGYQFKTSSETEAREGADLLMSLVVDALDESVSLGVTSYGAAHVQGRFPWAEFCYGFGSPQFYTANPYEIKHGVKKWLDIGFAEIIPSVPAYGANSKDALGHYLITVRNEIAAAGGKMDGLIAWSWGQLDAREWSTLQDFRV